MRLGIVAFMAASLAAVVPAAAQQPNVNIRGTISAFDGGKLTVKTREGKDVTVEVPEAAGVSVAKAFSVADIKPGMNLAVTALKRADGVEIALDVRPLGPSAQASSSPYDLQPGSSMNNAPVEAIAAGANGQELALNGKNGPMKVLIVAQTTMSQSGPGTRADIKAGETVFLVARPEGDKFVAVRLQVSKDGVKPGQ